MNKKIFNLFKSTVCGLTVVSVFFFITASETYQSTPPAYVGSIAEPFKDKGVHISAKRYTSEESERYLNRNLQRLGFQPVQVTIQNNTAKTYLLSDAGMDIAHSSAGAIATKVTVRSIPRSVALKVAGFFFWPFLIPSAIDSIVTFKSHLNLRSDYYAKSIKDEEEEILPFSTVNRIIFISSHHDMDRFTLHLKEGKSQHFTSFPVTVIPT